MPRSREEYEPRDWSRGGTGDKMDEFREYLEYRDSLGENAPLTPKIRERPAAAFIGCKHTVATFVEVENDHGVWGMEVCIECGRVSEGPQCPHVHCTWHFEGRLLICDNCGTDCT